MPTASNNAEQEAQADQEWIERQLARVPPPTWEQWAAANAALGIKVERKRAHA